MKDSATPPEARDLFVETADGRLYVKIWGATGAAAPLILFHDSLGCVELWRDFPEQLAQATGRAVIAYDRLGFGRSDPYPGLLPNDFIRREATTGLAAIRAHLGLGKMILFGHSVGGGMAVSAAAAFPEVTLAIVTESAQAFVEDCTLAGIREAQSAFETPGQIERLERYHDDKARWVLDAWVKTWQRPEFADWTLDDQLLRIHCPVLAMHGDKDEFGSGLHPERISGLPPGLGRIVILENCGHVPHREQPEAVLRAVCEFLAAQD